MKSLAIEETIRSFGDLRERFGLQRSEDDSFFAEWHDRDRTDLDRPLLDRLRQRYLNYYNAGAVTEGTVLLTLVSPLLESLGFYDLPFRAISETPIAIEAVDRGEVYRGRIDILVVRDRLWVLVVEAKRSRFAADAALPQCLAYMLENGLAEMGEPRFGCVTNGSAFVFCKLARGADGVVFDLSDPFSLLSRQNKLYDVAATLANVRDRFAVVESDS